MCLHLGRSRRIESSVKKEGMPHILVAYPLSIYSEENHASLAVWYIPR